MVVVKSANRAMETVAKRERRVDKERENGSDERMWPRLPLLSGGEPGDGKDGDDNDAMERKR